MIRHVFKSCYTLQLEDDFLFTLTVDNEFSIYLMVDNEFEPIGPSSSNSRQFKRTFKKDDEIYIETDGKGVIYLVENYRREKPSGKKLVEIIPDNELSVYDRLRAEMLSMLSEYSGKTGNETIEESDDYEYEDPDESDVPLTPYEYKEMQEEYLRENPPASENPDPDPDPDPEPEPDPAPETERSAVLP